MNSLPMFKDPYSILRTPGRNKIRNSIGPIEVAVSEFHRLSGRQGSQGDVKKNNHKEHDPGDHDEARGSDPESLEDFTAQLPKNASKQKDQDQVFIIPAEDQGGNDADRNSPNESSECGGKIKIRQPFC